MKLIRRKIWFLFLAWAVLFLIAAQTEEFSTLDALLVWIVTGGGAMILFGYVEAYLLENWPGWHTLPLWVKTIFPIVFAGLLGIIAQVILALDLLSYVPSWLQMVVLAGINWFFSQKAYRGIKDTDYASAAKEIAANGIKPVG